MEKFKPNYKVHPGKYVKELFEERNASMLNFCHDMAISYSYLFRVINGQDSISSALAQALSIYFEGESSFKWLNLQRIYDKW